MAIIGYNEQEVKSLTDSFQAKSQEITEYLNNAFQNINKIYEEKIFRPAILTTVNSLGEMIAKTNYIRSKNEDISIICVPSGVEKNMIVKVTDRELIDKTGGIVQGMSGSPIVQDGRLVGALTHVIVNNPEKGYAVFAQTMLEKQEEN